MHSVISLEVLARQSYQRPIARVIKRLNTGNPLHQVGPMPSDVVLQFRLRICGSGDQDRAGMRECFDSVAAK
jgi:hypothetical protein